MKFATATVSALLIHSVTAFAPSPPALVRSCTCYRHRRIVIRLSRYHDSALSHQLPVFFFFLIHNTAVSLQAASTRGEFLAQVVGIVAVTSSVFPGAAQAAKYGAIGTSSPGVLDPKDAIVDEEIFKSSSVQAALKSIQGYAGRVGEMKSSLEANSQVNLGPTLRKEFDFSKLRSSLNDLNSAFDEETQRGTDRLIRGIMQDLTELETANSQKEGIERSERRVANMNAKLNKLQTAFNDLLAFAP